MLEVYGSLGVVAGLAQALYLVTAFALGVQLLLRAGRSQDEPQGLLGLHLLLAVGLGYLLLSVAVVMSELAEAPPRSTIGLLVGTGYLATILGLGATLLFNLRVFRPGSRVARWLAAGLAAAMTLGWTGYGWSGGFPMARFEGGFLWLMMAGVALTNFWVSLEPLLEHRAARRRLALGLSDPLVANRFLLWGLASLARTAMAVCGPLAARFVETLEPRAALEFTSIVLVVSSALGLFASVAYWLTFFPLTAYARWVERRQRGHTAA